MEKDIWWQNLRDQFRTQLKKKKKVVQEETSPQRK